MFARFLPVRVALFVILTLLLVWSSPVHADTPPSKPNPQTNHEGATFVLPGNPAFPASADMTPLASNGAPVIINEVEPNDLVATANTLPGTQGWMRGTIGTNTDADYYRFTAQAGDRLYVSTQTLWAIGTSADTVIDVYDTTGVVLLETDNDDGSFGTTSSLVAGLTLPNAGQYYIRVTENGTNATVNRYDLFFRLHRGTIATETEPNNNPATATALPANGWIAGSITASDVDIYALTLNAGDSVAVMLDLAPVTRTGTGWNGAVFFGLFQNQGALNYFGVNDTGTLRPNGEAYFTRIQTPGTYYILVQAGATGATGDYHLSTTVYRAYAQTCSTFTSANVPLPLGPGANVVTDSTLTIAGQPAGITDINATVYYTHTWGNDMTATLIAPGATSVALFSNVGAGSPSSIVDTIRTTFDDQAPLPIYTGVDFIDFITQPEAPDALSTFNGANPNGTWTLRMVDTADSDGGNLIGWSIELCSTPLAVTLNAFDAQCSADGVNLAWETASETNLLGFNLYRAVAGGDPVQLNSGLIPSQSPGGGQGAAYTYTDSTVTDGNTYDYYLDAVNTDGTSQRFGPTTSAFPCAPTAIQSGALGAESGETVGGMAWLLAGLLAGTVVLVGAWRTVKR